MARVLLIDDDPVIRQIASRLLTGAGHAVLVGNGGADGLRLWNEQGADVVMTDLRMAGVDGFEVVREIHRAAPQIPLIITSGDTAGSAEQLRPLLDGRSITVLKKPFLRTQLLEAVAQALDADHPATGDASP